MYQQFRRCYEPAKGSPETQAGSRGIAPLQRLADHALDGRIKRRAEEAIASLREGRTRSEQSRLMREDLDKVRDDNKRLQERLDKLEALSRARDGS